MIFCHGRELISTLSTLVWDSGIAELNCRI